MRRVAALAALALALVVSGCGGGGGGRAVSRQARPQVHDLRSVDQLRRSFDAHPGVPRLIVLVSPT